MDRMAETLLEFGSDELAVLSIEGRWGSFRSALEDVETVATARIYLPERHAMQLRLQGVKCRFLVKLENRLIAGSRLCVDRLIVWLQPCRAEYYWGALLYVRAFERYRNYNF